MTGDGRVTFEHFAAVDIRVGRVVEVEDFPEARRPAWKLRVDFGPEIGVKRSSAQIKNYGREDLEDRLVLAVVNFPPRQIGPVRSEVLVLGTYSADGVLLLSPEPQAALGDRVGDPRGIDAKALAGDLGELIQQGALVRRRQVMPDRIEIDELAQLHRFTLLHSPRGARAVAEARCLVTCPKVRPNRWFHRPGDRPC